MWCCSEAGNRESGVGNRVSDGPMPGVLLLMPLFPIPRSPFPVY
jgi:hypothetical protein